MPLWRVDYTAVGDPALFSQFLSDNPDFKITKIIKERATKSDTIEKQLRTDEEEINAINAMSNKTHQTIATKYQKEYRPYLQKTFGGEVVFEDGGKRLTIDMEKYFKDPKKLWLPAYQRKPEYSKIMEIEETIRSVMSKQWTPEFGRFTIGQHIAWLQDYLVQNYPRQKQFIYQKISELITKHNVNDDFSAEVKKNREASMASAKKRWDKYKQPNKIDTLIELTPDTNSLLWPISLKEYMQIGKIPTEALGQYYEKFFKRLNNAFKERPWSVDTRNLSIEIDNLVEHDLMTNRDADKYKNMVSLMAQKRQWGVPKFQTKPWYWDDDRFKEQPIKIPWKKQMETPEPMKSWDEEIIGQSFTKDERYTFDFEYWDGRKVYKFRSPEGEILAEVTVKNWKIIDYNSDVDYEVNPRISYDPKDYRDNDMSWARFQTKDVISKQAEKYLTEWTYWAKNKSPLNQPKLTKEIEQELSKFKPKQPVKLYRAQKKWDKNQRLTSWTYDKDMAYAMIWIPEADFWPKMDWHEVITKKIHPDEILVDFTMLPKMKEEYINEVIVKPMQKQWVPKFQVKWSEWWQKAIPLSKVDNALIAEARKYKSADEFIEWYKTSKIKVFEDNVEEIGNIQTIRHDLHSYDPEYFYKSWSWEFWEYEKMIDKLTDNLDQVNILWDEKEYVKKIQALKNRIEDLDTDYMWYDEWELLTTISKWTEIKEKINDLIEEYLNKIEEKYVSEWLKHYSDIVEQLRDRTGSFAPSWRKRARWLLWEWSQNTSTIKKFTEKVNDTKLKQIREEAYKTKQQPLSKTIPQEANAWVPKFQVKNKAQSYFQEKLKQWLAEAKKDWDIADFSESRPKAIDGRMWYRIPWWGGWWGWLMSTPMGDGMYVWFDKKSVATFYWDYELPVEKNMERVKTYDLSSIKWLAENELPKDMRRNGNAFRKMTEKEQKKLAQRRKDYALQNWYDGILYYDPYTDNLIEGVVFKPVKEMDGLPKLQAKDVWVLKLKTKKTNTVGIPKSKQEFVEKYNAYPDWIWVWLKQMKPHALIKFEELFPSEWDNRKDVEEMEWSKQITDTYADNWRMKEMDPVLVTFRDWRRYVEDWHHRMLSIIKYATKKWKSPNRMKVPVYFSDTTLWELREDTHKSGMTQLLMNVEDIELKIRI